MKTWTKWYSNQQATKLLHLYDCIVHIYQIAYECDRSLFLRTMCGTLWIIIDRSNAQFSTCRSSRIVKSNFEIVFPEVIFVFCNPSTCEMTFFFQTVSSLRSYKIIILLHPLPSCRRPWLLSTIFRGAFYSEGNISWFNLPDCTASGSRFGEAIRFQMYSLRIPAGTQVILPVGLSWFFSALQAHSEPE
jgi:hypothetical protein